MDTITTYEDEYGIIEILPAETMEFCSDEMKTVQEFAQKHRCDTGFSDCYARKPPPVSLESLEIPYEKMRSSALQFAPEHPVSYSEYGASPDTFGFGKSENVILFFSCNSAHAVSDIWLRLNIASSDDKEQAAKLFSSLSSICPLLVAHWSYSKPVLLDDVPGITGLLNSLHNVHARPA